MGNGLADGVKLAAVHLCMRAQDSGLCSTESASEQTSKTPNMIHPGEKTVRTEETEKADRQTGLGIESAWAVLTEL